MYTDLSRTLAVAAAGCLLSSAFVEFTPGWAPVDYPLLGLMERGRADNPLLSLAVPFTLASLSGLAAALLRSRRAARYGAYAAAVATVHWFVLSPIHHGGFATDFGVGLWLALSGAAALALASVLPGGSGDGGGGGGGASAARHGGMSREARAAAAKSTAARHRPWEWWWP